MNETPTQPSPAPKVEISDDHGVAPSLIPTTIIVGLLLAGVGGGLFLWSERSERFSVFLTCSGLALIFAATGARAAGSWRSWSATGSGALMILLFLLYVWLEPAPSVFLKHGHITTELAKVADLRIIDVNPLYTYRDPTTRSIQFIVLKQRFRNPQLSIQVDTTEKGEGREYFEMSGDGANISRRYLSSDSPDAIKWTLNYHNQTVTDGADIVFRVPTLDRNNIELKPIRKSWFPTYFDSLAGRAFAQDSKRSVESLFKDLESDAVSVRRNARDEIVAVGPQAVEPLMKAFRESDKSYRETLGVTYGLNNMLRSDPNAFSEIQKGLGNEDFRLLVDAATHGDKTLHNQATQFLYNLKDKRVAAPIFEKISKDRSATTLTNSELILSSVSSILTDQEKRALSEKYSAQLPASFKKILASQ